MKNNKILKIFFGVGFFALGLPIFIHAADTTPYFEYKLMEHLPLIGAPGTVINLKTLILGLYQLFLWLVTIAALFMLSVGAFYYMTSAGNTSSLGTAKKIIGDSLIGLFMAMVSWGLLYIINPDLVSGPNVANPTLFKVRITGTVPATTTTRTYATDSNFPSRNEIVGLDRPENTSPTLEDVEATTPEEEECSISEGTCYEEPDLQGGALTPGTNTCPLCITMTGVNCAVATGCKGIEVLATNVGVATSAVESAFTVITPAQDLDLDGIMEIPEIRTKTARLEVVKTYPPARPEDANTCFAFGICANVVIRSQDALVNPTSVSAVTTAYNAISGAVSGQVSYHTLDCSTYIGVPCVADGGDYFQVQ